MTKFSFITPIAYDYRYALDAIRSYYAIADEIILGIDNERISWSGNKYEFDEEFFRDELEKFDKDLKIRFIQGNYHASPSPIANDTNERNALTMACKEGNYIIQIDSDESLMNPKEFVEWTKDIDPSNDLYGHWITVFKDFGDKGLVIDVNSETDGCIPIGTSRRGQLTSCRETGKPYLVSPLRLLHYSWGRTKSELKQKLENWGHSGDFDTTAWLELWDSINLSNYKDFKDIHPLYGPHWPGLKIVDTSEWK